MPDSSLEEITDLLPIDGADRIEIAKLGNFQTVVPKGAYNVGDEVLFIHADAVLPKDREWAADYMKYAEKRVKIVKLKGVFSEGIVVPLNVVHEAVQGDVNWRSDTDVALGITHYEPPVPHISGAVAGGLPSWLIKTDADRWETVMREGDVYYGIMTQKIDGTSATYAYRREDEKVRVFSRGIELDPEAENIYTKMMKEHDIAERLAAYCKEHGFSLAIRGEIYGNGIQKNKKNPHSDKPLGFAMFSVWNIDNRSYEDRTTSRIFAELSAGIPTVDVYEGYDRLTIPLCETFAERSDIGEGVVFWTQGAFPKPIKIISKPYDGAK